MPKLMQADNRLAEAEPLYKRAQAILEKVKPGGELQATMMMLETCSPGYRMVKKWMSKENLKKIQQAAAQLTMEWTRERR